MRLYCGPSKELRKEARIEKLSEKVRELKLWHPHFAWWPTRVGEDDCRWLETIERKFDHAHVVVYLSGRVNLERCDPTYRSVAWPEDGM